jgi:hypothetical protein
VWRNHPEAASFYSGARVPWGCGQVSGDDGDGGHAGPGEWARRVGDVEAVTTSVRALKTEHGSVRATSLSGETEADVVDELVVYRACARKWRCPGGGW